MRNLIALLGAMLLTVLGLTSTGADPAPRGKGVQDVYIFAPDELDPGARAGFRVVVMEATSLTATRPVRGARVEVSVEGKSGHYRLLSALTDDEGTLTQSALVPELKPADDYELVVKVTSVLGKTEKKHAVKVTPRFQVLLTTDKPLYQPGQVIHLRGVSLRLSDLKPVANEKATLEVEDPQGNKVFKKAGQTDKFGTLAADFQLADEIRLGDYKVRAVVGDRESEKAVTVKRYVLPKFKVVLDTEKTYYRPGEKVEGTVSANYFFGKPVDGGEVKITAQAFDVEFHTVAEVTGKTDKDGNFKFELEFPDSFVGQPLEKGDAFVKIDVAVTDNAKHTETATVERKVAAADLRLELVPEAGRLVPGVENKIYAVVSTPDDQPVKANVNVKVAGQILSAPSDDSGIAEVIFTPKAADFQGTSLRFSAEAMDKQGRKVKIEKTLSADNLRDTVLLRTNRALYTAGDDLQVDVFSTYNKGTVYLDLIRNRRTALTRSLELKDGRASDRISLSPDLFGTLELHAYVILPSGEIMRDTKVIYLEPANDLQITVSLDKETYRPGENARLLFKVVDKNGKGQAAALGISIVDESVFAIQEMQPGLLKVYFTLEKELAKPRYEVHFAPRGQSVERVIQDQGAARDQRDRVMKVLMAGVKNPTAEAWVENPGAERMQKEQEKIQEFAPNFVLYAAEHSFLEAGPNGTWKFQSGLAEKMIKDGKLKRADATDSFGQLYDPETVLKVLDPNLTVTTFAQSIASYRLARVYAGLEWCAQNQRTWLDKLFTGAAGDVLPDNALDFLVAKKILEKGMVDDPWGSRFVVRRMDENFTNNYTSTFKRYDVRSMGPDRKLDTPDDVTNPYDYQRLPYFWRVEEKEEAMMDGGNRPRRAGMGVMAAEGPIPPPMAAPAGAPRNGDKRAAKSANGRGREDGDTGAKGGPQIRVREYFPETLWWEPSLLTDSSGKAELNVPMADSITTWRMSALGHSATGLFGSNTSGIRVFQDFFVDIDFPVQLTQGDEVEVPVAVYNYMPGNQTVTLEVREHDGFDLLSPASQRLELKSGQVDVRYFRVKAVKIGRQTMTVYAIGSKLSDAIKRPVDVVPNGLRVEVVRNGRITGPLNEMIEIPDFAIPDASRIMVKIYPGVFAQVLEGMDGIFRMPSGCFEQTTSTTYPNVMVLAYMKKTKTISPEIQMKAEGYINLGYQRLLSFEVQGGGFEWFGRPPAHQVLTAYGLMEFYDMSKVYPIDEKVIARTQDWLARQQQADGSWKPVEHWIETLSGEAFSKSVELNTAYIAWSLAETGYKGEALGKSIRYLKNHLKEINDAYTMALVLNALVSVNPKDQDALDLIRRLDGLKIEDKKTGTVHWEPAGQTAVKGGGKTAMIETTSLILYAMIKAGQNPATVNKGLAWISQQKDAFGTFASTQSTILAMKVLIAAEENRAPDVRGTIAVSLAGREEKVEITPETSDVLRLVDFKDQTKNGRNDVSLKAPQDLGLMYQVVGIFYVPWTMIEKVGERPLLTLDVKYDRAQLKTDDLLTANVTATYNGDKATEMIVLDLGLPPGFTLITDRLEQLKDKNIIEKFTATGRQVTIYVRRLEKGKPLVFSYQLKAKFPVKAQTPKSSAYEYYNPATKAETKPVPIEVTK